MATTPAEPREGRQIRLLWLIDSLTRGGAERLTAAFARSVDTAEVRPRIVCLRRIEGNELEESVRREGIPVLHLGARNLRDAAAFARLSRWIRDWEIDVIHAHLTYATIWGGMASRLLDLPLVATLHVRPGAEAGARPRAREGLRCLMIRAAGARVLAVSEAVRTAFSASGLLPAGMMQVLHNGVDLERFHPGDAARRADLRAELGWPADARVAATVSVLRAGKGVDTFLRAAPSVLRAEPRSRFLVVGDGPEARCLEGLARRLGLGGEVAFTGWRDDVAAILAGVDVMVHASLEDAWPGAVLEGMAAGLPVVASRVGGIPELVEPETTGCLVPPASPETLGETLAGLLRDHERASVMGARARERVRDRYSLASWSRRLVGIYHRAAAS